MKGYVVKCFNKEIDACFGESTSTPKEQLNYIAEVAIFHWANNKVYIL